jgi:hypothetical protein
MRLAIPSGAALLELFPPYALYGLPGGGERWPQYKLTLPLDTPAHRGAKRSYRLTWGMDEQRFRFDRETAALRTREPALFAELEEYMRRCHASG